MHNFENSAPVGLVFSKEQDSIRQIIGENKTQVN